MDCLFISVLLGWFDCVVSVMIAACSMFHQKRDVTHGLACLRPDFTDSLAWFVVRLEKVIFFLTTLNMHDLHCTMQPIGYRW